MIPGAAMNMMLPMYCMRQTMAAMCTYARYFSFTFLVLLMLASIIIVINSTDLHKPAKNPFTEAIVEVVQPLLDRLGDETFLAGCENWYTQNRNESLHHVTWGKASKDVYSSPQEISLAISLGVLEFN